MEWIKFDIHTTTAEADAFGEILVLKAVLLRAMGREEVEMVVLNNI